MKIVIVGCGRVGASVAEAYDRNGHEVILLDIQTAAFDRLPSTFGGEAIRGDGTDEDVLRRAGAEGADVFLALTEGDNRNVMAAQLADEALGVERVIAKINDPLRAKAYAELGHRDALPDRPDGRRDRRYLGSRRRACPACWRRPAITTRTERQRIAPVAPRSDRAAASADATAARRPPRRRPAAAADAHRDQGGLNRVRARRRRGQGRLLPGQGTHRIGP